MTTEQKEVVVQSSVFMAGNIFARLLGLAFGIIVGKLLGAQIYGRFSYILSFLSFYTIFSKLGMENGIISFLQKSEAKKETENKKEYVTIAVFSVAVLSTVLSVSLYFSINFISEFILNDTGYKRILAMMAPTIILYSMQGILLSVLRGEKKINEVVFINNIVVPVSKIFFIAVIVLVAGRRNIDALVINYYIYLLISVIYLFHKVNEYKLLGKMENVYLWNEIFLFSAPLMFSGIVLIFLNNLDKVLVGYFLGDVSTGVYKMAYQFGFTSSYALIAVNTVFAPVISNLYHSGKLIQLEEIYKKSTRWITIINLMIFGILICFGKDLLILIGNEFAAGYTVLVIITAGQTLISFAGPVENMNIMTGNPDSEFYSNILVLSVNVVLNFLLIPGLGINGAAFAYMISVSSAAFFKTAVLYRNIKIRPFSFSSIKTTILFCAVTFFFSVLSVNIVLPPALRFMTGMTLYMGTYIPLAYFLILNEKEKREVKALIMTKFSKNDNKRYL